MRNRRLRAHPSWAAAILLLAAAFLNAQEPEREWVRETRYKPSPLNLAGELPGDRVTTAGHTSDWPAIAATRDGSLHVAYVEWIAGVADRIVISTKKPERAVDQAVQLVRPRRSLYAGHRAASRGCARRVAGTDRGQFRAFHL